MADILTSSTVINLDISIWTGKAKLQRTEVDDSALPPEDLVTLGSKKIFDPVKLKKFHGLKSNAFSFCNRYGVKFMSGWLVDNNYIGELTAKLSEQRVKWDEEVRKFLANYHMECQDWLAANPQWANILANALPRQGEIAKRFNFGWQVFNIIPAPTDTNGDQTQDELAIVPTRAIEKMAKEIGDVRGVYADGKSFRDGPLKRLAAMARSLSFSSPEVDKLSEVLNELANLGSRNITQLILDKLQDPKELVALCVPGEDASDILANCTASHISPEPVSVTVPDYSSLITDAGSILDEVQPALVKQEIGNQQAMSNMLGAIDSEGLW